jgi:hypothetical protein
MGNVVAQQFEMLMAEQMLDIAARAGEEVIDAQHLAARLQQPFAEMRSEKSGPTGDQDPAFKMHWSPRARG